MDSTNVVEAIFIFSVITAICLLALQLLPVLQLFVGLILEWSWSNHQLSERNLSITHPGATRGLPSASARFRVLSPEGLDPSIILSLPTFIFSVDSQKGSSDCAICLEGFKEERVTELPGCHHGFHVACIGMWFQSHRTCPICRLAVEPCHESESKAQVLKKHSDDAASSSVVFYSSASSREQFVAIPLGE